MKLAKLIAEEHYRGTGEEMARGMLENIVAAKLEPIHEALKSIEYLVITDDIALSYLRPALALFEEE